VIWQEASLKNIVYAFLRLFIYDGCCKYIEHFPTTGSRLLDKNAAKTINWSIWLSHMKPKML